ncbi:hypothetical protein DFS34DRAFT_431712 [Phlyctochytrium arcticum]|nr:hypothetical protein DFS34DRAFT_431712 [Phlyctochytrium arcticum]
MFCMTVETLRKEGKVINPPRMSWPWKPAHRQALVSAPATMSLLHLNSSIAADGDNYDEQDVRSMWFSLICAALLARKETGIDVRLEFPHMFEAIPGKNEKVTKSDITICVKTDAFHLGTFIIEVQKDKCSYRVHKDHIKTPGETPQQCLALLSTTDVKDPKHVRFHYGLVGHWGLIVYSMVVRKIDGLLWIVGRQQQSFTIGRSPAGMFDFYEQDVRSMWFSLICAALPARKENGIDVRLEFPHMFEATPGNNEKVTKSDITICVKTDAFHLGTFIIKVQKDKCSYRVHKDHIKTPGEIAQQCLALLSTTHVKDTELQRVRFHYDLVGHSGLVVYSMAVRKIDGLLWIVARQQQSFTIGRSPDGMFDLLRFAEFLNEVVVKDAIYLKDLLSLDRGYPRSEVLTNLPRLSQPPLASRPSGAAFTPVSKKTRTS